MLPKKGYWIFEACSVLWLTSSLLCFAILFLCRQVVNNNNSHRISKDVQLLIHKIALKSKGIIITRIVWFYSNVAMARWQRNGIKILRCRVQIPHTVIKGNENFSDHRSFELLDYPHRMPQAVRIIDYRQTIRTDLYQIPAENALVTIHAVQGLDKPSVFQVHLLSRFVFSCTV